MSALSWGTCRGETTSIREGLSPGLAFGEGIWRLRQFGPEAVGNSRARSRILFYGFRLFLCQGQCPRKRAAWQTLQSLSWSRPSAQPRVLPEGGVLSQALMGKTDPAVGTGPRVRDLVLGCGGLWAPGPGVA